MQTMYQSGNNTPSNIQVCSPMVMQNYAAPSFSYQQNTYPFSQTQESQMSPSLNMNMNVGMIFSPTHASMGQPVLIDNQGKITMMPQGDPAGSMSFPTLPILTLTSNPSTTSIDASSIQVCPSQTDEQNSMVPPVQTGLISPTDFSEPSAILHPMMCSVPTPHMNMIAQTSSPSMNAASQASGPTNPSSNSTVSEDTFSTTSAMSPGTLQQNMYAMPNTVVSPPGGFVPVDAAWMTAANLAYPQVYSPQQSPFVPYPPMATGFMPQMGVSPSPYSPTAFTPSPHYSAHAQDVKPNNNQNTMNSNNHHRHRSHHNGHNNNNRRHHNHNNGHGNKYNNRTKVHNHQNKRNYNNNYHNNRYGDHSNIKKSAEYVKSFNTENKNSMVDEHNEYCTERRNSSSSSSTCTRASNKSVRKGFRSRCKCCSSPASRGYTKELATEDLQKAFGDISHILDQLPEFFGEPQLNFPEIVSYIQMFRPEGTADELQYFKVPRPTKERELQVDVRLAELFVRNFGFDHACEASDFERISVHDPVICQARMVYRQVIVQCLLPHFHQMCDVSDAQDIFSLIFRYTGCCTPKDICDTFPQVWSSTVPVNSSTAIEITGVVSMFNYHLFRRYIVKKSTEETQV